MKRGLRRTLIAGAVLLALGIMLWLRLDSDALHAKFSQEVSSHTQASLKSESFSLTFLHGIGLRLNQVSLNHSQYQMQAGHISISIRLLSLLMGEIEIDTLNIHDGLFKIKPGKLQPNTKAMAGLPAKRLQLVRCRVETFDGEQLLDNLHLDLRNIGLDRETLWELQAKQGNQSLSGHGRLNFQRGEVVAGFGKLKLVQVPVSRLKPVVPQLLAQWLSQGSGHINGAITLDITERHVWSISGDVDLNREDGETPLRLRGTLSQPAKGELVWHDSFIHFDAESVVAIDGACHAEDCNTSIDAKNIPLKKWAPFIPEGITFHRIISGSTNLKAAIGWNDAGWQGTADFKLVDGTFSYSGIKTTLPALHIQTTEMAGDVKQWQTKAKLSFAKADGSISIESSKNKDGSKDMFISSTDADSSQLHSLANLLLASLDIKPSLLLAGKVSGELHLHQSSKGKKLQLHFNADQARLAYANWLDKPDGVKAQCHAQISWSNQPRSRPVSLKLQDCQLANSRLGTLSWALLKQQEKLIINGASINFDILRAKSIYLGHAFEHIHGQIDGDATATWSDQDRSNIRWVKNMSGAWRLQNFGTASWLANGAIQAEKGTFNSSLLQLNGEHGKADLKGYFAVGTKQGTINISAANLDWDILPEPHAIWSDVDLNGYIQYGQLTLLGNRWQNINSRYRLKQGKLELQTLEASLAGGSVTSPSLTLSPEAGGLTVLGSVHIQDLQLQELNELNPWLHSGLQGKLHANIQLRGRLPVHNMAQWKQSNGDILIYDGEWEQQDEAESLTEQLGIQTPGTQSYAFKKLQFRFRIHKDQTDISELELNHHDQIYSGNGTVDLNYHLAGSMQNTSDQSMYTLNSDLPALSWHPTKETEQENSPAEQEPVNTVE
jgi:hypothetical protein